MASQCPDPDLLSDYAVGQVSFDQRRRVEEHLSLCWACRAAVSRSFSLGRKGLPVPRWAGARRWAAAVLLLAVGIAGSVFEWRSSRDESRPRTPGTPSGRSIAGIAERLSGPDAVRLPDGTRLVIRDGAEASFVSPGSGERYCLRLDRGEVEAEVEKGLGSLRLSTPAGDVTVLGTRFSVRVVRFPFEREVLPVAIIEVGEGAVRISNGLGEQRLMTGHRGVLFEGETPIGPIRLGELSPGAIREAVRQLARLERPERSWPGLLPLLSGHRQAAEALIEGVADEPDSLVREMSVRCVAALGSDAEFDRLVDVLRRARIDAQAGAAGEWRRQAGALEGR